MEISEDIKNLYNFIYEERARNNGKLSPGQTEYLLDRLFVIHRRLIILEGCPRPAAKSNIIKLDAKLLAAGGTIKTYRKKRFLTPIITLFKRSLT